MTHLLDGYAWAGRWSKRHPAEKLLLGIGMLAVSMALPVPGGLFVFIVMAAVTLWESRLPAGTYLRILAAPVGFLLIGVVVMVFTVERRADAWLAVRWSESGAAAAAPMVARSLGAVACLLFLALATSPVELFSRIRIKWLAEVRDMAVLVYRFIFILLDTTRTVRTAQDIRLGYRTPRRSLRSAAMLVAGLLTDALDRARRMEWGLEARGSHGDLRVLNVSRALSWPALAGVAGAVLLVLAAALMWKRAGL